VKSVQSENAGLHVSLTGQRGTMNDMITLGLVLMVLGLLLGVPILWTVGILLLIVGLVLMLLGRTGRQVGGRAHYW
jgi:hypothetical protein